MSPENENENKVVDLAVKDGALSLGVDSNRDGEKVVTLKLHLSEAVQEAFNRSEALEGVKLVSLSFTTDGKMALKLDTDKDGEELLTLTVDLSEVADEIGDATKK